MLEWRALRIGGAFVVAAFAALLAEISAGRRRPCGKKSTPSKAAGLAFRKGMSEREYVALIPPHELKLVRQLLRTVARRRALPVPAPPLDMDAAWERVLESAQSPQGGGWDSFFQPSDMTCERLCLLAEVVDTQLLGGCLQTTAAKRGKPKLTFEVDDAVSAGKGDWISYFDEPNTIHLLRPKWSQDLSTGRPMVCEGVLCTTRLQLLAHTVAHEMVHALVLHRWPDIDAHSPAYLPDDRHGPIFKLLNKRLFGHASDSYRHVFGRPDSMRP